MSSPANSRRPLSPENSERLHKAFVLSRELQAPGSDGEAKLGELRRLLNQCRDGVRRQRPDNGERRLEAINQARNYLHFLPHMAHEQASGRLRSVSRRLKRALA